MKIALLSYHFANTTAEGLVTTKVARALVEHGHQVTVFTAQNNDLSGEYLAHSSGPLAGLQIYRVGHDAIQFSKVWRFLDQQAQQSRLWDKLAAIPNLIHGCNFYEWQWVQNMARQVVQVWQKQGGFDVLHTRLNPGLSHLAGLQIKKQMPDIAWCAYFSDPWPHHLYPEPYRFTAGLLSRWRLEQILDQILQQAGSCIFPSDYLKDYMLEGKRRQFASKSYVVPHIGTVEGEVRSPGISPVLTIRHAGFLMKERKIDPLYEGVRQFLCIKPEATTSLRIEFAGRYVDNVLPEAPEDLNHVVRFYPLISPDAIDAWMQDADVFLLVEAKMRHGIFFPSKLANYLSGERPIWALSPQSGVTADFLGSGGGILVEPDDVAGIARSLVHLHDFWREGRLQQLLPSAEQRLSVSPKSVAPLYEQAFQQAITV